MSNDNQPPPPPEMDAPLPPNAGEQTPLHDEYVEIVLPPRQATGTGTDAPAPAAPLTPPTDDDVVAFSGRSCVWIFGGMLMCSLLFFVVVSVGLFTAGREATDLIGNMANFFRVDLSFVDWDDRITVDVPDTVYVPSVERVQALSEIVTTRFNYSQVFTAQSDIPAALARLYGENVVMVAVGHIEAGIDVSAISEEDITYNPSTQTLTINLPAPALRACFLNESESYVVERERGTFADPSSELEDNTRDYALRQFREQALEDGILDTAASETRTVMQEFLQSVSPTEVIVSINIAPPSTDAPLPDTCR